LWFGVEVGVEWLVLVFDRVFARLVDADLVVGVAAAGVEVEDKQQAGVAPLKHDHLVALVLQ
jgi:hypothetical protein